MRRLNEWTLFYHAGRPEGNDKFLPKLIDENCDLKVLDHTARLEICK